MGAAYDCFELQSCLQNELFERFVTSRIPEIFNDSDENESFYVKKPSCPQRSGDIGISGLECTASDLEKDKN